MVVFEQVLVCCHKKEEWTSRRCCPAWWKRNWETSDKEKGHIFACELVLQSR